MSGSSVSADRDTLLPYIEWDLHLHRDHGRDKDTPVIRECKNHPGVGPHLTGRVFVAIMDTTPAARQARSTVERRLKIPAVELGDDELSHLGKPPHLVSLIPLTLPPSRVLEARAR